MFVTKKKRNLKQTQIIIPMAINKLMTDLNLPECWMENAFIFIPVNTFQLPRNRNTHTQPFNGLLSGTTRVGQYQKKHSPTHTHPGHRTSFIIFLHLQRSMASFLFSLRAWQSSRTTSLQVLFGLPLGLGPSTSYSMHFFTQSSSFRSTYPYQRSLFCCNTNVMSSIPSLSLSSLSVSVEYYTCLTASFPGQPG